MEIKDPNMQSNSFSYSIKVWLTSVALGPMVFFISNTGSNDYHRSFAGYLSDTFVFYMLCLIFGGLFSFLTWLTFLFVIKGFFASRISSRELKGLIALSGVLLTIGTFALWERDAFDVHNKYFYLMLTYAIGIAGGSLLQFV